MASLRHAYNVYGDPRKGTHTRSSFAFQFVGLVNLKAMPVIYLDVLKPKRVRAPKVERQAPKTVRMVALRPHPSVFEYPKTLKLSNPKTKTPKPQTANPKPSQSSPGVATPSATQVVSMRGCRHPSTMPLVPGFRVGGLGFRG